MGNPSINHLFLHDSAKPCPYCAFQGIKTQLCPLVADLDGIF
jgi:hypothetical protein